MLTICAGQDFKESIQQRWLFSVLQCPEPQLGKYNGLWLEPSIVFLFTYLSWDNLTAELSWDYQPKLHVASSGDLGFPTAWQYIGSWVSSLIAQDTKSQCSSHQDRSCLTSSWKAHCVLSFYQLKWSQVCSDSRRKDLDSISQWEECQIISNHVFKLP